MKTNRPLSQESRGMVMVICLTILSVLLAVGIGIRVMLQNDYRALANLRGGTEAFYYSAAGLEWSKNEIASATAFPPAPPNQTKTFASGNFAVAFLSPVATSPLTAKVTIRSVGTVGSSSHTVQAQLSKTYDLADGAIVLRGNPAAMNLGASGIFFSGADHDPASGNVLTSAKPRSAISTSNGTVRNLVAQAVSDPTMLDGASANPAVGQSGYLPATVVTQLANDLCAAPGALLHSIPPAGSLVLGNQTWGSQSSPQLHCVDGSSNPGDALALNGNVSGVGILVVRNADLSITGSFRWEGLILVTGQEVGLKTSGSSSKEVIGAAVINETGAPGSGTAILDIQGSVRMLFSRQALRAAAPLIPATALSSAYSALPTTVAQDYWRTVSP